MGRRCRCVWGCLLLHVLGCASPQKAATPAVTAAGAGAPNEKSGLLYTSKANDPISWISKGAPND